MDEEKKGQVNDEPKSALNKGTKKLKKQAVRKFFRKIILAILPKLLIAFGIALATYIVVSSIANFLDALNSEESKDAFSSSISYTTSDMQAPNRITINPNNTASDGAYELMYKYNDDKGNEISESQAIKKTKEKLVEENEKIKLNEFSDSELKILGILMNNGLETGKYNEKELKALAIFTKAEIAGQSFDLRPGTNHGKVTIKDLENNDKVYGTLELHKTTAGKSGEEGASYTEIKLEYVPYQTFKSMIESTNNDVLTKYSIDDTGKVVIAKLSTSSTKYTYLGEGGEKLSEAELGKVNEVNIGEDEETYIIREYAITIDYKQYIKKYLASYGFLSDLLIATNNVDFCLEIAELALNSKIVINIREEQVDVNTYNATDYTQTSLLYHYVTYTVNGYNKKDEWIKINEGTIGTEPIIIDFENYKIEYEGTKWIEYKRKVSEDYVGQESKSNYLIANDHISESYDSYSIDEDYTAKDVFNYTVIIESSSTNFKYDIDISEIDCWYLDYKRPYASPTVSIKKYEQPEDIDGEFPQNAEVVQELTSDLGLINSDPYVTEFIKEKEDAYLSFHSEANVAEGSVTELKITQKQKTDSKVQEYDGTRTLYGFGDESNLDTTSAHFKNIEYVNNALGFTTEGKKGFLYIYDKYIKEDVDLCLQNDAEKKFFELLEADGNTSYISEVMRFLLYVYDGIDRGVTDLDQTFKIIDMTLTDFYSIAGGNAFGCNIPKEAFIAAAEAYGKSILSGLAPQFYDICTKYNVNPCLAYAWAALESGWGKSATVDKNLFQMGSYNDASHGFTFESYEASIENFCQWVVNAANPSSSQYSFNNSRAQEYATVNNKFKGTPDKNIYALFSTYSWVGYTHTPNARACIHNTYTFLNDGVYECNHSDSDATTLKERADYMQYQVELRVKIAEDVFGQNILLGSSGEYQEGSSITSNDGSGTFAGIYKSSSGRTYSEWIQGAGEIGQKKLFDGRTMGEAGCGVYAAGTLASSTGIEPTISQVYQAYRLVGGWSPASTIYNVLDRYGVSATVKSENNADQIIPILLSGKGVMIHVGTKYGNLYTKNMHWIVLADIRVTQLGSSMGYDIYALTSNDRKGHGWHEIETVLNNIKSRPFYYIED